MKLFSISKTVLATLAFAACAGAAHADVLRVSTYQSGTTPYAALANTKDDSYTGPVALWNVTNQTAQTSFLAFCLELLQSVDQQTAQNYTSSTYNASADVQELYDRFYGSVTNSITQALGFQLALWELIGQTPDVNNFIVLRPADVVATADSMLNTVATSSTGYTPGLYNYTRWSSGGFQDVLQVTPVVNAVPEPQTHALLLGGLGLMAMGMVSRRRKDGEGR